MKSPWQAIWPEADGQVNGWLRYETKHYPTLGHVILLKHLLLAGSSDLKELSENSGITVTLRACRCDQFRSTLGSVTQTFDPVMGRFDFGELTGNKLLS